MGTRDETSYFVRLDITAAEFENYYAQNIDSVLAWSHTGQKIQFPANILQSFVSHSGIHGTFKIVIDRQSKFKEIHKVSEV